MPSLAGLGAVLRGRDFRRLFATRLISQFSDGVFQVGVAGYVLFSPEGQTSPAKAAGAAAILLLPYSVVGPFAGVFIDRWRRRQILTYAPLIRAGTVALAGWLLLAGADGPLFYLTALLTLGVNRFFLAALSAALPHVVDRRDLVLANALSVTAGSVATFAGAGVGYLLGRLFGSDPRDAGLVLCCAAALYVAAATAARTLDRDLLGPDDSGAPVAARTALRRVVGDLVAGARHIGQRRPAAAALGAITLHRFLFGISTIMTVLLFRNYFRNDAEAGMSGFALTLVISGVGFFLGAVITPVVTRWIRKQTWIAGLLVFGATAQAIFGVPFAEGPFMAGAFALGLVSQGVKISVDTAVQESVTDRYRGRVFSVYDMLFNAMFVAGFGVAALMLPPTGRSYAVLGVIVGGYAVGAAGYWLAANRPRVRVAAEQA